MLRWSSTFIIIFVMYEKTVFSKKIECPLECNCDTYKNFRRATCKNQSLVMIDAGIPPQVELLDLSYNLIYNLENNIFENLNLTSLKLLNLSHNKIGQIHMNAFHKTDELRTIDLSYNNVQYLLINWFWSLTNLQELYLQGNSLRRLSHNHVMESPTLKILNFHSCNLLDIDEGAFLKIPNLEILDLSANNLIGLKAESIKSLHNLKLVELEDNPWQCSSIKDFIQYCEEKDINCKDPCKTNLPLQEEKFQRMVVAPQEEETKENFWIIEEDDKNMKTQTVIIICNNGDNDEKSLFIEIMELSPVLTILVPFILGILLGLIIACTLSKSFWEQKVAYKDFLVDKKRRTKTKNKKKTTLQQPLIQSESYEGTNSTPLLVRKNTITL